MILINFYITCLTIFLFAWLWTQLTPVHDFINDMYMKYIFPMEDEDVIKYVLSQIWAHIDCHKCISFWSILIFTWNPVIALFFAWIAHITSKK